MHSVELLAEAIELAKSLGYRIRQEWLGNGGGVCEIRGQRWLFIDLSQTVLEQLDTLHDAVAGHARLGDLPISLPLQRWLAGRRAA